MSVDSIRHRFRHPIAVEYDPLPNQQQCIRTLHIRGITVHSLVAPCGVVANDTRTRDRMKCRDHPIDRASLGPVLGIALQTVARLLFPIGPFRRLVRHARRRLHHRH